MWSSEAHRLVQYGAGISTETYSEHMHTFTMPLRGVLSYSDFHTEFLALLNLHVILMMIALLLILLWNMEIAIDLDACIYNLVSTGTMK